jgi:tetratricopeptide (TPR) repeat protein
VTLARQAVELADGQGDDPYKASRLELGNYWSTLGVAHYQAGNLKEAIAALRKSLDTVDGVERAYVCENWIFLAMANWKLGRKGEARQWYDRAADWIVKKQPREEEIRRFRAEAAVMMRIEEKE